jgi:hypothetical protein
MRGKIHSVGGKETWARDIRQARLTILPQLNCDAAAVAKQACRLS